MKYRFCGNSGLQLPYVSLGLWHNFGDMEPFDTAKEIIFKAFENGVTHFDIANNYGPPPGAAELNFGKIMNLGLNKHRDEIIVSSKAGYDMWSGPYGSGGSRKHIISSLNQSLHRTGLEYFDIFYSHRYCPETPLEETVQALIDIVKQGKALYIGLSRYPIDKALEAMEMMKAQHVRCLIFQDKYSLVYRKVEEAHLKMFQEQKLSFIAFSPLAQGLLTNRYLNGIPEGSRADKPSIFLQRKDITQEWVAKAQKLDSIARRRGQSLAQMSLSWLLANERVTSVIAGASSVSQLLDNIACVDKIEFSSEELTEIDSTLE